MPEYSLDVHAEDPRSGIPARETLKNIIQNLVPPPNYKVVLEVDKSTENLVLRILKREPIVYRLFGTTLYRNVPSWDDPTCVLRCLTAKSYDNLLAQLRDRPEFLEFEFTLEGELQYA